MISRCEDAKDKVFMPSQQQAQNRYTWQQRQEDRSINQFRDRMHEFGWLPDRAERDVGEDLIVRIVTNNQPVGIPFYAQLKSVIDLADRRKANSLVYRMEVPDLLRWESSPIPVVLFVWDVVLREGRWATIKSLVEHLDQREKLWRKQKTISAYLPWGNTTTDNGLSELRTQIGHLLYQLIASDRTVEVNFIVAVPSSEDTINDRVQLEKFFREGTPVSIDGRYIQEIVFSEWWAEWFVDQDMEIREIKILPRPHPDPEQVSIMLFSPGYPTVNFPDVELRLIRSGTDSLVFSNEHQNAPIGFTLMFSTGSDENKGAVTYRVNHKGYNVLETREIARFQHGVRAGGKLTIIFKNHGGVSISMNFQPFQPLSENQSGNVGWDHRYMDLVESLCFIQERSGYLICIPDGDIAAEDVRAAYELRDILQKGKTEVRVNHLSITVDGLGMLNKLYELHRNADHGSRLMIQQDAAASHVVLFGEAIQVGPMTKTIVGRLDMTAEELEKYIQRDNSTKAFQLRLAEVEIVEKFVQWPHDSDNRDLQYYLER